MSPVQKDFLGTSGTAAILVDSDNSSPAKPFGGPKSCWHALVMQGIIDTSGLLVHHCRRLRETSGPFATSKPMTNAARSVESQSQMRALLFLHLVTDIFVLTGRGRAKRQQKGIH